jgi:hypothetical protein
MASLASSHLTRRASFDAYSARYDKAQHYLHKPSKSMDIEPSRSSLAGSVDMTTHSLSNQLSDLLLPARTTCPPPPPLQKGYASSLGGAEEGKAGHDSHVVRRVFQYLCFICKTKEDGKNSEPKIPQSPLIKHTTRLSCPYG